MHLIHECPEALETILQELAYVIALTRNETNLQRIPSHIRTMLELYKRD